MPQNPSQMVLKTLLLLLLIIKINASLLTMIVCSADMSFSPLYPLIILFEHRRKYFSLITCMIITISEIELIQFEYLFTNFGSSAFFLKPLIEELLESQLH